MHVALYSFQSVSSIPFFCLFSTRSLAMALALRGRVTRTHPQWQRSNTSRHISKAFKGSWLETPLCGPSFLVFFHRCHDLGVRTAKCQVRDSPFSRETRFVSRIRRKIADWEITWRRNGSSMTISKDKIF